MTYPKVIPEDRMMALHPIIKHLEDLPRGEFLLVEDSPASIKQIKMDLYAWWHQENLKSLFKIQTQNPGKIMIVKRVQSQPSVTSSRELNKAATYCRECLLDCEVFDQAKDRALLAVEEGTITAEEAVEALKEWERVCG
jgi:hypothetical protein